MIFKEGLRTVFFERKTDGEVTDPFFLYCRLSDLCSSGFVERKKVALFYAVDKRLCVFERLLKGDGEQKLLDLYAVVEDLITEGRFRGLVSCAAALVNEERKEKERKKRRGFFGLLKNKKLKVFL